MNKELTDDQIKPLIPQDSDWRYVVGESGAIEFARGIIELDRALQDARHAEELAAADLTISNLQAAQSVRPDIHSVLWGMRSKILNLPRYSFLSPPGGGVAKVPNRSGKWIEADDAAGLCEVEEIDAMLAAAPQLAAQPELTDAEICGIAKSTQTAEPGRDGYILPVSFARAVIAAHEAKKGGA